MTISKNFYIDKKIFWKIVGAQTENVMRRKCIKDKLVHGAEPAIMHAKQYIKHAINSPAKFHNFPHRSAQCPFDVLLALAGALRAIKFHSKLYEEKK